jgi:type I restriction enzyme M protein
MAAPNATNVKMLTLPEMEQWLWDAACVIRGATDAPKFKDFILPLVFYKRLSDVFDDEFASQVKEFGDEETAYEIIEADHADYLASPTRSPLVRFYIPKECAWKALRNHGANGKLGEFITTCMRRVATLNPALDGVLNVQDYNATQAGARILDDDRLASLVEVLSRHEIGLDETSADVLGHAYEYLLRKFAEGQGQSAGEFFTPMEVGLMMGRVINPPPRCFIYDPTMGSAGLLIKAMEAYQLLNPDNKGLPEIVGQELNPTTWAMAKMNAILHGYEKHRFLMGDTFRVPGHATAGVGISRFDRVVANPMWNQKGYPESFFENDPWNRFKFGHPPSASADWAWAQHIVCSLNDGGVAAMVIDTGAASRGSGGDGNNKEKTIRAAFVNADLIEAVILLPENLFYNTTAAGLVMVFRKGKPKDRAESVLVINASQMFVKGRPKNVFTEAGIQAVVDVYQGWETREKFSRVLTLNEVRANDFNLSPSAYIQVGEKATHRDLADILVDLDLARDSREKADHALHEILARLGLNGGTLE